MRIWFLGIVFGLLAISTAPAVAKDDPREFAPTSQWVLDYAAEYCSLRRAFEHDGMKLILEFRQYGPGRQFDIIIMGEKFRYRRQDLQYRFSPHTEILEPTTTFGMTSDVSYRGVLSTGQFGPKPNTYPAEDPIQPSEEAILEWAETVDQIEIVRGFGRPMSINLGPFRPVVAAMNTCLDELVAHWGIDAEGRKSNSRNVAPKDAEVWAKQVQKNYPREALQKGYVGTVQIRMIVDPQGKPSECRSLNTFTNELLDNTTCSELMEHAVFEPALDAEGQPVSDVFMTRVVYKINS